MKLIYFAWVREKVGISEETQTPPETITNVGELVEWLKTRGDVFREVFAENKVIRVAVNFEYVSFDHPINPDDEIAFFPPVTGG